MAVTLKMDVSKTVKNAQGKGVYEKIGEVSYWLPTLEDTGLSGFVVDSSEEAQKESKESGLPVYKDAKHNFILSAIHAAVKGINKNRLIPETVTLKEGMEAPLDWDSLMAVGQRGGNAAALAALRELKEKFAAYLLTTGKSEKVRKALQAYFNSPDTLAVQDEGNKAKVEKYIVAFASSLDEAALLKHKNHLAKLEDALSTEAEEETEADEM